MLWVIQVLLIRKINLDFLKWFQELPFDDNLMESTLVDEKISNLLGVLKWDLRANTDTNSTFDELFSFG